VALAKGAGSLVCGLRNALDGDDDDDDDGGGCARGRLIRVKLLIKYQFISANSKHTHNQPATHRCGPLCGLWLKHFYFSWNI